MNNVTDSDSDEEYCNVVFVYVARTVKSNSFLTAILANLNEALINKILFYDFICTCP